LTDICVPCCVCMVDAKRVEHGVVSMKREKWTATEPVKGIPGIVPAMKAEERKSTPDDGTRSGIRDNIGIECLDRAG
jgi:hypothetical protein